MQNAKDRRKNMVFDEKPTKQNKKQLKENQRTKTFDFSQGICVFCFLIRSSDFVFSLKTKNPVSFKFVMKKNRKTKLLKDNFVFEEETTLTCRNKKSRKTKEPKL